MTKSKEINCRKLTKSREIIHKGVPDGSNTYFSDRLPKGFI